MGIDKIGGASSVSGNRPENRDESAQRHLEEARKVSEYNQAFVAYRNETGQSTEQARDMRNKRRMGEAANFAEIFSKKVADIKKGDK